MQIGTANDRGPRRCPPVAEPKNEFENRRPRAPPNILDNATHARSYRPSLILILTSLRGTAERRGTHEPHPSMLSSAQDTCTQAPPIVALAPPTTPRCPLPSAHGSANAGLRGRRRRPDLRGGGGDAMAMRRARAELSSPGRAHEACKHSSPPDRTASGADGAQRGGLIGYDDGSVMGSFGQQQCAGVWTGRIGERPVIELFSALCDSMRMMRA